MTLPDHYLLTVALHALLLSSLALLAVLVMRRPQRIALAATAGLLAAAILPWFTALRPKVAEPSESVSASAVIAKLPEWTVVRVPVSAVQDSPRAVVETKRAVQIPDSGTIAGAVWAAGALVMLAGFAVACRGVARWRRDLIGPDDEEWRKISDFVADGPERRQFLISASFASPCVLGFRRPVIVIPRFLFAAGRRHELRWALGHEVRHWKDGDSRWTVVLAFLRILQWWNPLVHVLIARWKVARECVCDLSATNGDHSNYGEFLIAMAARSRSRNPLAVTMVTKQGLRNLRARILTLLNASPDSNKPAGKFFRMATVSLLFVAALAGSGMKVAGETAKESGGAAWKGVQISPFDGAPEVAAKEDDAMAKQVRLGTTIVCSSRPVVTSDFPMGKDKADDLIARLSKDPSNLIHTLSKVIVREGEISLLEILREDPQDQPWKPQTGQVRPDGSRFAGWSIAYQPSISGDSLELKTKVRYGTFPGKDIRPDLASLERDLKDVEWEQLRMHRRDHQFPLLSVYDVMVTPMGEIGAGKHVTVFTSIEAIDAIGREPADVDGKVKPSLPGKFKFTATLVDRPSTDGLAMLGEAADKRLVRGFEPDEWEKAKGMFTGITLAPVEIPAGQVQLPWDELPDLSISGILLSGNKPQVALRLSFPSDAADSESELVRESLMVPSDFVLLLNLETSKPEGRFVALKVEVVR